MRHVELDETCEHSAESARVRVAMFGSVRFPDINININILRLACSRIKSEGGTFSFTHISDRRPIRVRSGSTPIQGSGCITYTYINASVSVGIAYEQARCERAREERGWCLRTINP